MKRLLRWIASFFTKPQAPNTNVSPEEMKRWQHLAKNAKTELRADLELLAQLIPAEPFDPETHEWHAWRKLEEAYERLHSVISAHKGITL